MMKIPLLILVITIATINSACQEKEINQHQKFEKEFNVFRYSLYKDLNGLNPEKLRQFDFNDSDSVTIKINTFCKKNKKRIKAYQTYKLNEYLNPTLKLNNYTKDSLLTTFASSDALDIYMQASILELVKINPFEHAGYKLTIFLNQKYPIEEFATIITKDRIAQGLVYTNKLNNNEWEIIMDKYNFAYRFVYDLTTQNMKIIEVLKRNP